MKKDLKIIPECYVDTNLVETLLALSGCPLFVNHQKGCNTGANVMQKLHGDFALGMIDNDKQKHSYTNEFCEIARTEHLSLRKHSDRNHYLIVVEPKAVDLFILDVAKRQNVNMADFGFSANLDSFTKETKQVSSKEDDRFKLLFKALQQDEEFQKLKTLLQYFHNNSYCIDKKIIMQICK